MAKKNRRFERPMNDKELKWHVMHGARFSVYHPENVIEFLDSLCAFSLPKELYLWLIDFYLKNDRPDAVPIIEQKLGEFKSDNIEERFDL